MELEFHTPATYRIRVKGHLQDSWSDRLGGMTIEVSKQEEDARETTLVGQLVEQLRMIFRAIPWIASKYSKKGTR